MKLLTGSFGATICVAFPVRRKKSLPRKAVVVEPVALAGHILSAMGLRTGRTDCDVLGLEPIASGRFTESTGLSGLVRWLLIVDNFNHIGIL
jgi:hypothetical protein